MVVAHPDLVEFVESRQPAERLGVDLVALVGGGGNQPVAARVADDEPRDKGAKDAGGPACQRRGLDGQGDLSSGQGLDMVAQVVLGGGEAGDVEHLAALAHRAEHRGS